MLRIYTLPKQHPLNKLALNSYKKQNVDKQSTPLCLLPKILNLPSPKSIEKISPPKRAGHAIPNFSIKIPGDKEKALEEANKDNSALRCYSDGSGYKGVAGAAAVLMRDNDNEPLAKVRYQLGPLTEHTTFDSEGVGMLLCLHLLQ